MVDGRRIGNYGMNGMGCHAGLQQSHSLPAEMCVCVCLMMLDLVCEMMDCATKAE